jgi:transcriptional regulator with XRE-family HTH domain
VTPSELIRSVRRRHGIDQRALARRAGTSQAQISRIERGEISPSVTTLERLLQAMGERLDLGASRASVGNQSTEELRADFEQLAPADRFARAAELSSVLTDLASRRTRR